MNNSMQDMIWTLIFSYTKMLVIHFIKGGVQFKYMIEKKKIKKIYSTRNEMKENEKRTYIL